MSNQEDVATATQVLFWGNVAWKLALFTACLKYIF
jgi:hypothetical protein